jgi:flavin-binding protein dodecin
MAIIKIIELISELDNSWKDVVEKAVTIASKTYEIFNQYGLEIQMQRL